MNMNMNMMFIFMPPPPQFVSCDLEWYRRLLEWRVIDPSPKEDAQENGRRMGSED